MCYSLKGDSMIYADTFLKRLLGLAFKKEIVNSIKFENCNSIHTFFMKCPIDVYLVDKSNKILYIYKSLKKNRIILPRKGVYSVYETKVNKYNYNLEDTFIE